MFLTLIRKILNSKHATARQWSQSHRSLNCWYWNMLLATAFWHPLTWFISKWLHLKQNPWYSHINGVANRTTDKHLLHRSAKEVRKILFSSCARIGRLPGQNQSGKQIKVHELRLRSIELWCFKKTVFIGPFGISHLTSSKRPSEIHLWIAPSSTFV